MSSSAIRPGKLVTPGRWTEKKWLWGGLNEACESLAGAAAGTGDVYLTKRDKLMLVHPHFGLSLVKGIICFLCLLAVPM